jgi:nicotinamidase-related amidase
VTLTIDAKRSALLVMDFQADIIAMLGDRATALLDRTAGVIAAARKAQLPIIYIVVGFRPGYPELNLINASFAAVAKTGRLQTLTPGADIVAQVKPVDGDVVIQKHRVGAFTGTELDMVLRAKGADTMIMAGLSTSGVVLSTVRMATDLDYRPVVIKDCCADPDDEVHRVLTEKVFARHAAVVDAADVTAALVQG